MTSHQEEPRDPSHRHTFARQILITLALVLGAPVEAQTLNLYQTYTPNSTTLAGLKFHATSAQPALLLEQVTDYSTTLECTNSGADGKALTLDSSAHGLWATNHSPSHHALYAYGPGTVLKIVNDQTDGSGTPANTPGVLVESTCDASGNCRGIRVVGQNAHGYIGVQVAANLGIGVQATTDSANNSAVHAVSTSSFSGTGSALLASSTVLPAVRATATSGVGVSATSESGTGLVATSASDSAVSASNTSTGTKAALTANSTLGDGSEGKAHTDWHYGVVGRHDGTAGFGTGGLATNWGVGVYGAILNGGPGYAAWFDGPVHSSGWISKPAGSFKIDHPVDPANKYLSHSFVESPDMLNVYNGIATLDASGTAWVALPNYWPALNASPRYQLTPIGAAASLYIAEEYDAASNRFRIGGGKPGMRVSWQLTGVRIDAYARARPMIVEQEKEAHNRGKFLNPEVHGQRAELRISAAAHP